MNPPTLRPSCLGQALLLLGTSLGIACGRLESSAQRPRLPGSCRACSPSDGGGATTTIDASADGARVVLVSVDGLGAVYLQPQIELGKLPHFAALTRAGASTFNARADVDYTVTLPNHVTMLTGRPVAADPALADTVYHGWTDDGQPAPSATLHNAGNANLTYVASVFDVVHDHGLSTCLYAGKSKLSLFSTSYDGRNGAPDRVGDDDGRNKIDRVMILESSTETLIATAEAELAGGACDLAFVHIADLDMVGHANGWGSDSWLSTLTVVDDWIGRLAAASDPKQSDPARAMVLTADHGGEGFGHSDASLPADYTIPLMVAGPGIPADTDLYDLVGPGRAEPGDRRPRYSEPYQPVRNADVANLVARLLGVPPVPGSFMRDLLR